MEKNNQPLVSIVIPCYNHEKFVQDSIQGVIDQTYENIELIIIDDGSKDNSVEKIKQMLPLCNQRFVRFEFRSRTNKGLSSTLNEALDWCEGEYYSAIASDDIMGREKTVLQVEFLNKNKEVGGIFGGVELIDNNGTSLYKVLPSDRKLKFKNIILSNYSIMAPTQMLRMNIVRRLGAYPYPSHLKIEDWYMWLRLSEVTELSNMPYILAKYRYHDTNTMKNVDLINKSRLDVLSQFTHSNFYKRAVNLVHLTNYLEKSKKIPNFLFFYRYPSIIFDILFYKKIIQFFLGKFKL